MREHFSESPTVTLPTGERRRAVYLNSAATTQTFASIPPVISDLLLGRGAAENRSNGPLGAVLSAAKSAARNQILEFLGVSSCSHGIIYTCNSSDAIDRFIRLLGLNDEDVVITSEIEHTSNIWPWKLGTTARVRRVRARDDGRLDYDHLGELLREHGSARERWVALSGASNQTGSIIDFARVSQLARQHDFGFFVDAAQLAPHRPISMGRDDDDEIVIDALVLSAHKLYAYAGIGALVVRQSLLERLPAFWGGGSVDMARWNGDENEPYVFPSPPNERHNPGSPFAEGQVALGLACEQLAEEIGWDEVTKHEEDLIEHAVGRFSELGSLQIPFAAELYTCAKRIGTFPFLVRIPDDDSETGFMHHAKLGAILQHEYAIETRSGTICNHPIVARWHGVTPERQAWVEREIEGGNRLASYGVLRVSLGLRNSEEDIDSFVSAIQKISSRGPELEYRPVREMERFDPIGIEPLSRASSESLRAFLKRLRI